MKVINLVLILLSCTILIFGQESALDKSILVDPGTNKIDVYVPPTTLKGWNDESNWVIVVIDNTKKAHQIDINKIESEKPDKPDEESSMFSIVPTSSSKALINSASQIIVNFGSKVVVLPPIKKPATTNTSSFGSSSNKQNSDVYLNGSYSPGFKGDPQYSIDGSVSIMFDISKKNLSYGQLGFVGSVKTDKRKKVDPDSYRLFLAYQNATSNRPWGRLQGVQFTWLTTGTEFDRKGDNINLITAPYLDFPIRLFPKQIRARTQPMAILTPTIGFETGRNFRNAVTPNKGRNIFRGVIGADLLVRFNPKIPGFQGVEFTNSYMLRSSAVKEIYTLTKKVDGKDVDVPFLNRKPRHYTKSELGFKFNDYFSFSIKHEYGMIPPVFRKIDHKMSFGFTFSAKQTANGIPTTIRNK
jgi:hypothetical protein